VTTLTLVDSEATARNWARSETHITAQVGTRTFFSVPIAYSKAAKAPWIVMTLVSETFQVGDLGLQEALIQFDCFAADKASAAGVAIAVQTAARQLTFGAPVTVGTAVIAWAEAQTMRWLPDPTLNTPRYVVDVLFAMHGAEA
jgi:hypothetical protein